MASRIKGITVEIGGDTSGLEKSLSAVNNSIKKTQSQLAMRHHLLKMDIEKARITPGGIFTYFLFSSNTIIKGQSRRIC